MTVPTAIRHLLSECKVHGNGEAQVMISDSELYVLMYLSCSDLGWNHADLGLRKIEIPSLDYYSIPIEWFTKVSIKAASPDALLNALATACEVHADYTLFIKNLSALHRRRVKYGRILASQPVANIDQIAPRSLLEYGACRTSLLCNWMLWRKWIYDIDNRSAQETGYFFEPVLASCLGGESIGARNSPVKRLDDRGRSTNQGRQIDCFVAGVRRVYELKMRVSIAASGQGRFGEELSFPKECQAAGFAPFLLVLDPTLSNRLEELEAAFRAAGGSCFKGQEAWEHMEDTAGEVVSKFIEKYIKPPLKAFEDGYCPTPSNMTLTWSAEQVEVAAGDDRYVIARSEESEGPES